MDCCFSHCRIAGVVRAIFSYRFIGDRGAKIQYSAEDKANLLLVYGVPTGHISSDNGQTYIIVKII